MLGVDVLLTASLLAADLLELGDAIRSLVLLAVANELLEGRAPLTICLWFSEPPGITIIGLLYP